VTEGLAYRQHTMSSELPSASSRSVFSVFGFGSSHYSPDDDFSCPLESAPESFDASNSLTALTKKKKKAPIQEETVTTFSPETAHRMQINLPDQSELALQSFSQPTKKISPTPHPSVHHSSVRRYSTAQEETDDVHGGSTEVLTKFSHTLTQTAYMLTKAAGSSTNIYNSVPNESADKSQLSTSPYIPILSRVKSSPHLAVAENVSPQKESLLGSEIISQYLRRNQSQNDLLEVAEYKMRAVSETPNKDDCDNTHSALLSERKGSEKSDAHSSGLSILSRTRQFGAWLTKATEGDKVEVTKKDLNVLAPTSF
jgi:hypothetical protein